MRKVGVYLGLMEDQDRDDDASWYDDNDEAAADVPATAASARSGATVAEISSRRRPSTATAEASRITTLHPRTYNEARAIGEYFRDGTPVIMNLTDMDDGDAKRLVDFGAGLVFAVHGQIERITSKVFLLSPPNVSVTAEDKRRLVEGGFFNQS